MWRKGFIEVDGEKFRYCFKQYDRGSEFGIDHGRISKMTLERDGQVVYNYDRGDDIAPADETTLLAVVRILRTEN